MTVRMPHRALNYGQGLFGPCSLLAAGAAIAIAIGVGAPLAAQEGQTGRESGEAAEAGADPHPFPRRLRIPEFPRDAEWLNVGGPLRLKDLRGKFVLLDFWTYCCINCIHILPELKKLERAYPDELVVVGVHSAKFEAERGSRNIEEAILRYEIEHPVVNDPDHRIWRSYFVRSWPTVYLVDPSGQLVWGKRGEVRFEEVDAVLKARATLLPPTKVARSHTDSLRTPGRQATLHAAAFSRQSAGRCPPRSAVHRGQQSQSDRGHHTRRPLRTIIGSGQIGRQDGGFATAHVRSPPGDGDSR